MSPEWIEVIIHLINSIISPLVQGFMMVFISFAATKLAQKWGIDQRFMRVQMFQTMARQGVAYAEEAAAAALKGTGEKIPPMEKLKKATQYMLKSIPEMTEEEAIDLITAILGQTSGVGATGTKTIGTTEVKVL